MPLDRLSLVSGERTPTMSPALAGAANIGCIPQEILLHIFSFLGANELRRASQVCRLWHQLSQDPGLLKSLFQRVTGLSELPPFMEEGTALHVINTSARLKDVLQKEPRVFIAERNSVNMLNNSSFYIPPIGNRAVVSYATNGLSMAPCRYSFPKILTLYYDILINCFVVKAERPGELSNYCFHIIGSIPFLGVYLRMVGPMGPGPFVVNLGYEIIGNGLYRLDLQSNAVIEKRDMRECLTQEEKETLYLGSGQNPLKSFEYNGNLVIVTERGTIVLMDPLTLEYRSHTQTFNRATFSNMPDAENNIIHDALLLRGIVVVIGKDERGSSFYGTYHIEENRWAYRGPYPYDPTSFSCNSTAFFVPHMEGQDTCIEAFCLDADSKLCAQWNVSFRGIPELAQFQAFYIDDIAVNNRWVFVKFKARSMQPTHYWYCSLILNAVTGELKLIRKSMSYARLLSSPFLGDLLVMTEITCIKVIRVATGEEIVLTRKEVPITAISGGFAGDIQDIVLQDNKLYFLTKNRLIEHDVDPLQRLPALAPPPLAPPGTFYEAFRKRVAQFPRNWVLAAGIVALGAAVSLLYIATFKIGSLARIRFKT